MYRKVLISAVFALVFLGFFVNLGLAEVIEKTDGTDSYPVPAPAYSAVLRDWYSEGDYVYHYSNPDGSGIFYHKEVRGELAGSNYYGSGYNIFYYVLIYPNGTEQVLYEQRINTADATQSETIDMGGDYIPRTRTHSYSKIDIPSMELAADIPDFGHYKVELRRVEIPKVMLNKNPMENYNLEDKLDKWNAEIINTGYSSSSWSDGTWWREYKDETCATEGPVGNIALRTAVTVNSHGPEGYPTTSCSEYNMNPASGSVCKYNNYMYTEDDGPRYVNHVMTKKCWIERSDFKTVKVKDLQKGVIWSSEWDVRPPLTITDVKACGDIECKTSPTFKPEESAFFFVNVSEPAGLQMNVWKTVTAQETADKYSSLKLSASVEGNMGRLTITNDGIGYRRLFTTEKFSYPLKIKWKVNFPLWQGGNVNLAYGGADDVSLYQNDGNFIGFYFDGTRNNVLATYNNYNTNLGALAGEHTYELLVLKNKLVWYVDGNIVKQESVSNLPAMQIKMIAYGGPVSMDVTDFQIELGDAKTLSKLAEWKFDENNNKDSVGTNHGMGWGSVGFGQGYSGRGLHFDGGSGAVAVPNVLNGLSAFKIEAWFKYEDSGTWRWIYGTGSSASDIGVAVTANRDYLRYHLTTDAGSFYNGDGNTHLNTGRWYHLEYVYDGSEARGYIDGDLDFSRAITGTVKTIKQQAIGAGYWDAGEWFKGDIDEVAIYGTGISTEMEVKIVSELFSQPKLKFAEGTSQELLDKYSGLSLSFSNPDSGNPHYLKDGKLHLAGGTYFTRKPDGNRAALGCGGDPIGCSWLGGSAVFKTEDKFEYPVKIKWKGTIQPGWSGLNYNNIDLSYHNKDDTGQMSRFIGFFWDGWYRRMHAVSNIIPAGQQYPPGLSFGDISGTEHEYELDIYKDKIVWLLDGNKVMEQGLSQPLDAGSVEVRAHGELRVAFLLSSLEVDKGDLVLKSDFSSPNLIKPVLEDKKYLVGMRPQGPMDVDRYLIEVKHVDEVKYFREIVVPAATGVFQFSPQEEGNYDLEFVARADERQDSYSVPVPVYYSSGLTDTVSYPFSQDSGGGGSGNENTGETGNAALPLAAGALLAAGAGGIVLLSRSPRAGKAITGVKSGFTEYGNALLKKSKEILDFIQEEKNGYWKRIWEERMRAEAAMLAQLKVAQAEKQKAQLFEENKQSAWAAAQANEAIEMLKSGKGDPGWFVQRMQYLSENSGDKGLAAQFAAMGSSVQSALAARHNDLIISDAKDDSQNKAEKDSYNEHPAVKIATGVVGSIGYAILGAANFVGGILKAGFDTVRDVIKDPVGAVKKAGELLSAGSEVVGSAANKAADKLREDPLGTVIGSLKAIENLAIAGVTAYGNALKEDPIGTLAKTAIVVGGVIAAIPTGGGSLAAAGAVVAGAGAGGLLAQNGWEYANAKTKEEHEELKKENAEDIGWAIGGVVGAPAAKVGGKLIGSKIGGVVGKNELTKAEATKIAKSLAGNSWNTDKKSIEVITDRLLKVQEKAGSEKAKELAEAIANVRISPPNSAGDVLEDAAILELRKLLAGSKDAPIVSEKVRKLLIKGDNTLYKDVIIKDSTNKKIAQIDYIIVTKDGKTIPVEVSQKGRYRPHTKSDPLKSEIEDKVEKINSAGDDIKITHVEQKPKLDKDVLKNIDKDSFITVGPADGMGYDINTGLSKGDAQLIYDVIKTGKSMPSGSFEKGLVGNGFKESNDRKLFGILPLGRGPKIKSEDLRKALKDVDNEFTDLRPGTKETILPFSIGDILSGGVTYGKTVPEGKLKFIGKNQHTPWFFGNKAKEIILYKENIKTLFKKMGEDAVPFVVRHEKAGHKASKESEIFWSKYFPVKSEKVRNWLLNKGVDVLGTQTTIAELMADIVGAVNRANAAVWSQLNRGLSSGRPFDFYRVIVRELRNEYARTGDSAFLKAAVAVEKHYKKLDASGVISPGVVAVGVEALREKILGRNDLYNEGQSK